MKTLLCLLVFFLTPAWADPFNIQLPFNTQYEPESLGLFKRAVVLGYEEGGENFQLQLAPTTGVDRFIETEPDHDFMLGFKIGLGKGFEFEIDSTSGSGYASIKYSFESVGSDLKHSLLFGKIVSMKQGHGGLFLQGNGEDCDLIDVFCWLSDIFGSSNSTPDRYEYNYDADIDGSMVAYLQGYQYSSNIMPYWGVYYVAYDIAYSVIDNTGAGVNQNGHIDADLSYLTLGARINYGKPDSKGEQSIWLINYVLYKNSSSHTGNLGGELRVSYINRF